MPVYIDNQTKVSELHEELLKTWTIMVLPFLFLFHIGLILFEAGAVHQHKAFHTLQIARYLVILAICGITFFAAGFGFSQNAEGGVFGDSHFFGVGYTDKDFQQWSYFYSLCSGMCLLSTSTLTERISLETHLFFAFLNCALIFPLIQAWTLHGGWLVNMGFYDKSEIGVFHLASGVIGFIGCIYCGPRSGRFCGKFQKEQYMLVDISAQQPLEGDAFSDRDDSDAGDLSSKSPRIDTSKKRFESFRDHKETEMENYSHFFLFVKQLTHQLLSSDEKQLTPEHITMLQTQQNNILGKAPLLPPLPPKIEEEAKEEQSSASDEEKGFLNLPPPQPPKLSFPPDAGEDDGHRHSGGENQPSPILSAGKPVKSVELSQILPMIDEEEENPVQGEKLNQLDLPLPENASSYLKTQQNLSISSASSFKLKSQAVKQAGNETWANIDKKQISPANTTRHMPQLNPLSERSGGDRPNFKRLPSFRSFSQMKEDLKRRMSLTQGHSQSLFPNLDNGAFSRRKKLDAYAESNRRNSVLQSQVLPSRKHSIPNLLIPSSDQKPAWEVIVNDINRDLDRIKSQELQRRNRIGSLAGNMKAINLLALPAQNPQNGHLTSVQREQINLKVPSFPQLNVPLPPLQPQGQQLSFFKRIRQNSLAPAPVFRQSRRNSMFGDVFLKSKQSDTRLSRAIVEGNALESPIPTLNPNQESTYFRREEGDEIEPNTADSMRPVRLRQASVALSQSEHQILDQISKLLEIQNLKSQNQQLQSQGLSNQAEEIQKSISKLREEEIANQGEPLEIIDEHQEPNHVSDKSGSLSSESVQDSPNKLIEAPKEHRQLGDIRRNSNLFRLSSKKIEFSAHFGDLSLPEEDLVSEAFDQPDRKMSARVGEQSASNFPVRRSSSKKMMISTQSNHTRGLSADSPLTVTTSTSALVHHSQALFEEEAPADRVDEVANSIKAFKQDFKEFSSLQRDKVIQLFALFQEKVAARRFGVQDSSFLAGGALLMLIFQLGLNCGMGNSLLTMDSTEEFSFNEIPLILMNTLVASAAGAIFVVLVQQSHNFLNQDLQETTGMVQSHDIIALCNGLLAGAISISAGCNHFTPLSSLFVGCLGSGLYYSFRGLLLKFEVDDPVEVTKVHGICAFWGLLAVGLFDDKEGFVTAGSVELLAIQLLGAICIVIYTGLVAIIFFSILKSLGRLCIRNFYQVAGQDEALAIVGNRLMKKANLYQ